MGLELHQNTFGGRAAGLRPDPLGEL